MGRGAGSGFGPWPCKSGLVGDASWAQGSRWRAGNRVGTQLEQLIGLFIFWREGGREGGGGRSLSVPSTSAGGGGSEGQGTRTRAAGLTCAHADLAVGRGAEVAEEALVRVAGVALSAQLAQLLGAYAAAAAAVQHQADAGGAARRRGRALALAAAVLAGGGLQGAEGGQPGARPSHRRALPFPGESLPTGAGRRWGLHALTRLQRANRSTKAKRTEPRPAADMVGALRTEARSTRQGRPGGCGAGGGTVDRGLGPEVGSWTRRAVVSGAVGRGGCRQAGGGRSPVVGVALAASSQRGRVVV